MLTVLMSVYEGDSAFFLSQALQSVWDSQVVKPDQIVLVQDGPLTSELYGVVALWKERLGSLLTLVVLEQNKGLGVALNEGLKFCKYDLVARMDADDISLPQRFKIQLSFMRENSDVAASSADIEEFDEALLTSKGFRRLPTGQADIIRFAKRRSPLNHIPSIYRKSVVENVGGYPPLRKAQDYALWTTLLVKGYKLSNQSVVLAHIRAGEGLVERRGWSYFKYEWDLLKYQRRIGFLSRKDFFYNAFLKGGVRLSPRFIKRFVYRVARS